MRYQTKWDELDPDVAPSEPSDSVAESNPDAPNDAYHFDERGNTIKAPDADARKANEQKQKRWVGPLAYGSLALCALLTIWNIVRVAQGPPGLPIPAPAQIKQTLYMGVLRIDAYKRVHGVTPEKLSDAGLPDGVGFTYQRTDSAHYVLGFQNRGPKLEYSSKDSRDAFFGPAQSILPTGGSQ